MKRISNLFFALVLVASTAALAQDSMNKTMTGRVISSSAFELVVQNDAGTRMNLVLDSTTSKPAILEAGDPVTVVYKSIDTGGYQAIQVIEGTSATEAPKAGGSTTRTLTNTSAPGTNGQTGDSRTTVIGTTGGFQAPAKPGQPNDPDRNMNDSTDMAGTTATGSTSMGSTTATGSMGTSGMADDRMAQSTTGNDPMANDKMANNSMARNTTGYDADNTLPRTAGREPAVLVFGLVALGAAMLLMRRRTSH